jgi:ankyrin repeat protein
VEQKLNQLLDEFQNGYRETSILSTQTADSISDDEKQTWRDIRKELEEIGISVEAFDLNKRFIMQWFRAALQRGDFQDQMGGMQNDEAYESDVSDETSEAAAEPTTASKRSTQSTETNMTEIAQSHPQASGSQRKIELNGADLNTGPLKVTKNAPNPSNGGVTNPKKSSGLIGRFARVVLGYDDALCEACRSGESKRVNALVAKGANVNSCRTRNGQTYRVIELAIMHCELDVVIFLLHRGATGSINTLAIATGYLQLGDLKTILDVLSHGDMTIPLAHALRVATLNSEMDKLDLLLSHGANVNGDVDWRPLQYALETHNLGFIKALVARGANLLFRTGGVSPLRTAALGYNSTSTNREKIMETLEYLLQNGADPNESDLMSAIAVRGDVEVAKLLIKHGATPGGLDLCLAEKAGVKNGETYNFVERWVRDDATKKIAQQEASEPLRVF